MYQHLGFLCNMAEQNVDPVYAAGEAMKFIPEELDGVLLETVEDPECLNKMIVAEPRVANHREWFEKLRGAIIANYSEDSDSGENG